MLIDQNRIDDIFFEDRFMRKTSVPQPFGHTKVSDEVWIEQFREFVEKEGKESLLSWIYEAYSKHDMDSDKVIKELKKNFRRLEQKCPELYEEVMTPDFMSLLLFHASCKLFFGASLQARTNFLTWVRRKIKETPSLNDMWDTIKSLFGSENDYGWVILDRTKLNFGDAERIFGFISAWKYCMSTEIEIDLADRFQTDTIFAILNIHELGVVGPVMNLSQLLSVVSYFHNNKGDYIIESLAEHMINTESDREILYYALKKNLITRNVAYMMAEEIISGKEEKYEYMPMLIMKIHEGWKEIDEW